MKLLVTLLAVALLFGGCEARRERLTGPYLLRATDTDEQTCVAYDLDHGDSIERIPPMVFEVGWDDHFIVAKQHPGNDRTFVHYYILETATDSKYADPSKSVTGPLSQAEFERRKAELKLPDFRRKLKHLE